MALWLILMFLGLATLGFVFYKVWTATETGIDRKWLAAALVGTAVSIVGLVMTLRTAQNEPSRFVPQATLDNGGGQTQTPQGIPLTPSLPGAQQPGAATAPKPKNMQQVVAESGIPRYDPEKYPEDPNGETFNKEDIQSFVKQTQEVLDKLENQVSLDMENENEDPVARSNRWILYNMDHELNVENMRKRSTSKNGPGTGRVQQLVYAIGENLIKMERVYHNAAVLHQPLDLNYIQYLRESTEKLVKQLEKEEGHR